MKPHYFLKSHFVIFIPGLGNDTRKLEFITRFWAKYGLKPLIYPINWHSQEKNFSHYLTELSKLINDFISKGNNVSVIGCSAGGSAALNAFYENNKIHKVVNVCGRLKKGSQKGFRSYNTRTKSSSLFAQSVEMCETKINNLSKIDRKRIMTIRPLLGDELVPGNTIIIRGANNILLPTGEHLITIGTALTIFAKKIINFLKN